jgi:hypothetical protein
MSSQALLVFLYCLLPISTVAVAQDLRLDKLSDCSTLAQAQSMLQQPVSQSCRSPRNQLEGRLMSMVQITPRLSACLLVTPPSARLAGFSCVDLGYQGTRELLCFNRIDDLTVRKYQDNYDPEWAYRYKRTAAGCAGTNGDASEAGNSLFPQSLSPIATARFGFVVGLGGSRIPLARAYHGFGSIDPSLAGSGSDLEVFDMIQIVSVQNPPVANSTDSIGEWKFDIYDTPEEFQRDLARPFEQASGKRIGVRLRVITISTTHSSNTPFEDRASDLERSQQAIADDLKDEGFRSLTPAELASMGLGNTDAMRAAIIKNMNYGPRASLNRTLGPHVVFLVNDEDDDCNKLGEAFVFQPEKEVKSDRGGMGLSVFTIGRCRSDGGPDEVLDPIIQQETEVLKNEVRQQ